ncbi:hypothetical protein PFISCL1PPCAC_24048, partial [Pristionchus fissidentatus]
MVSSRLLILNFLRFFVISLSIVLLFKLHRLASIESTEESSIYSLPSSDLLSSSLDSENSRLLRLHELLARPQIKCDKKLHGEAPEDFFLCTPNDFKKRSNFTSGLLLSGSSVYRGDFVATLPITKWTAIVPPGDQSILRLSGAVDVHNLEEIHRWREWKTEEIEKKIRDKKYSLAILHLYSGMLRPSEQLIKKLTSLMTSSFILLIARIKDGTDADLWTNSLNHLFYEKNLVLIGATSSGLCGRTPMSCEYRISLSLIDPLTDRHLPPPFNLGSPQEESHRLLQYLSSHHHPCHLISPPSIPSFCSESIDNHTRSLLLTYRNLTSIPPLFPLNSSRLTIVSPHN